MELCPDSQFLFLTMMQAAIRMEEIGKSKEDFISFAAEIWESLKLNDRDELKSIIIDSMMFNLAESIEKINT